MVAQSIGDPQAQFLLPRNNFHTLLFPAAGEWKKARGRFMGRGGDGRCVAGSS